MKNKLFVGIVLMLMAVGVLSGCFEESGCIKAREDVAKMITSVSGYTVHKVNSLPRHYIGNGWFFVNIYSQDKATGAMYLDRCRYNIDSGLISWQQGPDYVKLKET